MVGDVPKKYMNPGKVVQVNKVPRTVRAAAELFLKVRRSQMSKASYRVVPSKVRRFVDFLGADLPCANVNAERWKRWMSWVSAEVKAGRLAEGTGEDHLAACPRVR